jgi:uncharacterized protein YjbJ (UPF0337 family)
MASMRQHSRSAGDHDAGAPFDPSPGSGSESTMGERTDDLKGRTKEALGDLTDDRDLEREGKIDQAKAKVKETTKNVTDKVGDKLKDIDD